jgi:hypothetical protein
LLSHIFDETKKEDELIKTTITNLMEVFANNPVGDDGESENQIDYETIMGFAAPLIKDFIDMSVKNKKHYIDLATVSQKFLTTKQAAQAEIDSTKPWEVRKEEIIKEAKETAKQIAREADVIKNTIDSKVGKSNGSTGQEQPN